jgi:predicted metal-binding membrane protein
MDAAPASSFPALPPRDRRIVLGTLAALAALSWAYLWFIPMPMPATTGGLHGGRYAALTFLMWLAMMIGMMLPSVTPTVLLFERVNRRGPPSDRSVRTAAFVLGYLLVWLAFSVAMTLLQIGLIGAGWIDGMGAVTERRMTAALLAAIGLYQWAPVKEACLAHCRSPVQFLVAAYRPGRGGALRMGAHHGLYCLGCCWALMLLLFVGGVMNLLWVAAIAALILLEKLAAAGNGWRMASGTAALFAAGALVLARG